MLAHFTSLMIQASLVLALLFLSQPMPVAAQIMPPPAPLIRDARFDSKPVNIGTQLKHARPFGMVRQTDGKRVLVGTTCAKEETYPENARCPNIVLTRYEADGRPDLTFGNNGISYDGGSNVDGFPLVSTRTWFYDVNGKPDTKAQTSQPFLFDVTAQPDGSFFRSRSVVNQDSLDVDITHLVPANYFAKLPAVLR